MKRISLLLALAAVLVCACGPKGGIYQFSVSDENGDAVSLSKYKGKVLLVVNTATRCGFTPQYTELEALYEKYRDKGFEILDFPCNQFGEQAPGSYEEIHDFCTANFNIQFPQFDKIDVNGENAHPLYVWLKEQQGFQGFDLENPIGAFLDQRFRSQDPQYDQNPDIKWNFTKFLVNRRGQVVARFEPTAGADDIEKVLKKVI